MSGGASSRYDTILKLASGGMATVWVGTVRGALGFRQLVAIKKPHPHLLDDAFRLELVGEARLASLIHHANVVDVRDVEVDGESISLIMDYIEGASLGELVVAASKRGMLLPPRVAVRIALDALAGLHAAHELVDERGRHVGLVHRDVSPQNILVGVDGLARVADFGVAKFARKNSDSSEGSLKGKLAYMAPEYLRGEEIDRRFDVFGLGIVLWETLAGKRLFRGANEAETLRLLLDHQPESLSAVAPEGAALDGILKTALSRPVEERFQNAQAMAAALESTAIAAGLCGGHTEVAAVLKDLVGGAIEERRALIRKKLANEPSLGSLMGGVAPAEAASEAIVSAPQTIADVPHTVAMTPRLGGGVDLPPTATTQPLGGGTVSPYTSVPSTLPMTPRMEGAPAQRTLASPGAPIAPVAPVAPVAAATLASASPLMLPAANARSEGHMDTQLSFNDPSARSGYDPVPAPPRNKVMPLVAGIALVVVAAAGIAFVATRSKGASANARAGDVASAEPAVAVAASAPATAVVAVGPVSVALASASVAPSAVAPATTGRRSVSPRSSSGTGGTTAPAAAPSAVPATPTGKKPPPNPYANE